MVPIQTRLAPALKERRSPLWARIGFWACTAIAVAVAVRRILALTFPPKSAPPQLAALDTFFSSHAALTLAHIIPALAFVLVAPFVVIRPSTRAWAKEFIYPLGAVVGITAYAMSVHAVGGWIERSAVLFFNSLFLFSLIRAYRYGRQDDPRERPWMLRAIVVLLGIATTRPVMGVFFATSRLTHLTPHQFFGIAFWIGFSINVLVFEIWVRSQGRLSQPG